MVKKVPANAGDNRDVGSISGPGRSPGGGHRNPIQYSYLDNTMYGGAWWATAHRVVSRWTRMKQLSSGQSCTESNFVFYWVDM